MNTLINSTKNASIVVNNIVKNGAITRGLKSDLKIKWVRPEKIPSTHPSKSGDLGIDYKTSPEDLANHYEQSEALKNAPDIVKKLFTLEFQPISETAKKNREKARNLVKRHEGDYGSAETELAIMTSEIHYLQEYMEQHPRNKVVKFFLKELIDKRRKHLNNMRRWDYKRFEWLLEKMNIVFKPYPELWAKVTRKDSLRKLTSRHCDEIRQEKLTAYRTELETQQRDFFKEKAEKLAFIRSEEIACGVEPTVTEEEVAAAQEKAAQFQ